jgi:hypothetical protein
MSISPLCPEGLLEVNLDCEGVELTCFFDYIPAEFGSTDSMGLLYEPDRVAECVLVNAYLGDVDIGHLLLQYLIDDLEAAALKYTKD